MDCCIVGTGLLPVGGGGGTQSGGVNLDYYQPLRSYHKLHDPEQGHCENIGVQNRTG